MVCSICLEALHRANNDEEEFIGCENKHWLHIQCFTKMAMVSGKTACPQCRASIVCAKCGNDMKRVLCMWCYIHKVTVEQGYADDTAEFYDTVLPSHCVWATVSLLLMLFVDKDTFPFGYYANGVISVFNALMALDACMLRMLTTVEYRTDGMAWWRTKALGLVKGLHCVMRLLSVLLFFGFLFFILISEQRKYLQPHLAAEEEEGWAR